MVLRGGHYSKLALDCLPRRAEKLPTNLPNRFTQMLRIFALKRDEVTGEWKKLYNAELNDLYSSPNIVRVIKLRRMRWAGHAARMGERRGVYRVLVGKPERKRPFGRPTCRWEDNIKMDLQEVRCGGMDWIELAQHRIGTGGGHS